jgi:hypothetical protein
MANKSRKTRKPSQTLFAWPKILIVILPLFAAALIMVGTPSGRSVLGENTTNLLNINHEKSASGSGQKCQPNKVAMFSVSTLCGPNLNGFKQISYKCADGTSGTVTNNCTNVQSAFEKAMRACSKTSKCKPVKPLITKFPHPSGSTEPTGETTPSHNPTGL